MKRITFSTPSVLAFAAFLGNPGACAQSEFLGPVTVPPPGLHFEFANTAGAGMNTQFSFFGVATHADWSPPDPPMLHTLVMVFEWRIGAGAAHDFTNWAQSPDNITTVIGGMPNDFSTRTFITPGAWDTVALHLYSGFPITLTGRFDHSWTALPGPGSLAILGCTVGVLPTRSRQRRSP